ncbi:peptidoglycan D,D-transpeptidase FtsI family protein [Sporomusa sp.]|uniref:peptidoglycan D,D-transpeptidase FtsI family protein n=1 Tax=Sporomusa sp. TaxID=2078658 RepID=UPI002C0467B4|nr:penicillin-binding transpeptidase domain-containing protein [Sporomusa sp.]HWR44789.1 penicillin-binding transpeptidase domain-containing protein [Sporomusa sp.]
MKNNTIHDQAIRRNIRKVALFSMGLLITLLGYVTYLQVIESNNLTFNPLNRRTAEASLKVERGQITDSHGKIVALSKLTAQKEYRREYPYDVLFAHVVGYDSPKYGKTGIESIYDGYLSGQINPERRLGAISQLFKSTAGNNVTLTIDARLQQVAYQALGTNRGAIVALSPKTGAILAMVSRPGFDPDSLEADWNNISQSASSPLLNRATQGLYPPGSIIKVLVAEAALAEQTANSKREFNCTGSLKIGPDYVLPESGNRAHGKLNLEEALAVSCNVTFGQLALDLGRTKMAKSFERYGFSQPLRGDILESPSKLPDFSRLGDGDLAQSGIGQGSLLVTPLRMAMLASTFANRGIMMKPYLVQKITAPDGTVISETSPEKWLSPVDAKLANQVAHMMVTVVKEGTGSGAAIRGVEVAGKTGTAENPHGSPHAWFIGFAPADNPQIAIAVIVENAGSGGSIAAPAARQVLVQALR